MTKNPLRRLISLGLWAPIAVVSLVLVIALAFNLLGIQVMKGLPAWQEWRANSYWYFFSWRGALYSVALSLWLRYRDRQLHREPSSKSNVRKAETAVILSLLLLELTRAQLRMGA